MPYVARIIVFHRWVVTPPARTLCRGTMRLLNPKGVGRTQESAMPDVTYRLEPQLAVEEFIDVLVRSTLAERRPVSDIDTIRGMLKNADVIATARVDGRLVGVSRAITDFAFCTYLSDL